MEDMEENYFYKLWQSQNFGWDDTCDLYVLNYMGKYYMSLLPSCDLIEQYEENNINISIDWSTINQTAYNNLIYSLEFCEILPTNKWFVKSMLIKYFYNSLDELDKKNKGKSNVV